MASIPSHWQKIYFFIDSQATIDFLAETEGDDREHIRWLWGMKSIDELLDCFDLNLPERYELMQRLKENFAKEFRMNNDLKQQLDKKYRYHRSDIVSFLDNSEKETNNQKLLTVNLLKHSPERKTIAKLLQHKQSLPAIDDCLASHIHMMINRLLPSQQRLHELVIYDFLFRYYQSKKAQLK